MSWTERFRRLLGKHTPPRGVSGDLVGVDRVFAELTGGADQQPMRFEDLPTEERDERRPEPVPRRRDPEPEESPTVLMPLSVTPDAADEDLDLEGYEKREMRRLFAEVVGGQLGPLKEIVAFLRQLPMSTERARAAIPSLKLAHRSASELGLLELCPLLEIVEDQLERSEIEKHELVDGSIREGFLRAYADLEIVFPEAFTVDDRGHESLQLYAELRSIPDMSLAVVDRVFEAGLDHLEAFAYASPTDLAVAADLPPAIAEQVWRRVQTLREGSERGVAPGPSGPGCPRCGHSLGVEAARESTVRVRCGRCRSWIRMEADSSGGRSIFAEATEATPETPFELLGVSELDALDVIRRAYRRRVVAYHPDKVAQLGGELRDLAEAKTRELNLAMDTIERARR